MERRSTSSDRKESSDENRTSIPLDLTNSMTSMALWVRESESAIVYCHATHSGEEKSPLGNPSHVLAVTVLPQETGSTNNDINTVNTSLNGEPGIIHVATDMGEDPVMKGSHQESMREVLHWVLLDERKTHLDLFKPN